MRRLVLGLLLLLPSFAFAQRSLYWDSVAVTARLDDRGRLHVREQQTYVFDGDWNGGERRFRIERGQELTFESMSRIDDLGNVVPMQQGSLDAVDGYQFVDATTLRWRSRLPSDPPFRNTRITYVLEYSLSNILLQRGDRFILDHDFAFPDRSGEIRRFTLRLDLDPAWTARDLSRTLDLGPLPPGDSAVVNGTLEHEAGGAIGARQDTLPLRLGLVGLIIAIAWALLRSLFKREEALGRFAPLETDAIHPIWIEKNLLPVEAEVIGAAWDENVGENEVAALLARWAAEGKITADPKSETEMVMRLVVPREEFTETHERELVDKLFFAGDETSTTAIRAHYRQSGFSPTLVIAKETYRKAAELTKQSDPAPPVRKVWTLILFLVTAWLVVTTLRDEGGRTFLAAAALFFMAVVWMIGFFIALHWRGRIDYGEKEMRGFIVPVAIAVVVASAIILSNAYEWKIYFAFATAAVMIANSTFNGAKSKRGRAAVAYRKRLAAARDWFGRELQKPEPQIDDRWYPYVLAFGMNEKATAWARDFGAARSSSAIRSGSSFSSGSSSSSSPRWTGGGGAFGGAGATGSWGAAATGIASGVASARSSSSGGGGGGSSSSGGGGGGGW